MSTAPGLAPEPKPSQDMLIAVAQVTASMGYLKDGLEGLGEKVTKLQDAHTENIAVQQRILDNLKNLIGNGPQALEPVIPKIIRQVGEIKVFVAEHRPYIENLPELKKTVERHDRFQFKIGVIYSSGAAIAALLAKAAVEWVRKQL